jgi:phenylalanyl-tRNA synthetase beta chain
VLKALNILSTALAERGGDIESVNIGGEDMPDLSAETMELDPEYFRDVSGVDIEDSEIVERLEMMKYGAESVGEAIGVEVPCYRNDVMQPYDLIEDILIAHRYTNIDPELPQVDQIGEEKEIEDTADVVRDIMSGAGALEAMTYIHENRENLTDKIEVDEEEFVKIDNPLSEEYSALRNLMTPSLLEVLKKNKHRSYPQRFFETGNVAVLDESAAGSSNKKKMAYIQTGEETDFTDARKMLQVLERDLGIELEVEEAEKPFFQDSRSAAVFLDGEKAGFIGQFSEEVLKNWELEKPGAGFELDLEKINEDLKK